MSALSRWVIPASRLRDLPDVDASALTDGDLLKRDNALGKWKGVADPTARVTTLETTPVIDTPNTSTQSLRVFTTNTAGRIERFTVENNQDTPEVDVNIRGATVNIGATDPAVHPAGGGLRLLQPVGSSTNPIKIYAPGQSVNAVSYFAPFGTLVLNVGSLAGTALQVGKTGDANPRLTVDEFGNIRRGPGGATALASGIFRGTGTPEGAVTAGPSSIYQREDGTVGSLLYVKQTGTGNTGWAAFA